VPGPSTESFDLAEQRALTGVARASVEHSLRGEGVLAVDAGDYSAPLRAVRASFVTLRIDGALRGCTGHLEPERALVVDVAQNAHRSAVGDPRFDPLGAEELRALAIHISVLSPLEPLPAESERALLDELRPGIDGLVLHDGAHAATFLPSVWETLAAPREFLHELQRKAGLPPGHWSPTLRFERYEAVQICEHP